MTDEMKADLTQWHRENDIVESLDGFDKTDHFDEGFKTGWQAHASRTGWVEIDNPIVETWKDGRSVDFARYVDPVDLDNGHINPDRIVDCFFCVDDEIWLLPFASPLDMSTITHARLPPPPPSPKVIT